MKTNIILALDTRRPKIDGTCPILLRIVHYRESSQISTGYSVAEKDWDDKLRKVKSSFKGTESVSRLNNVLIKKRAEAMDVITKLEENKKLESLSVVELKAIIEGKTKNLSFFEYGDSFVNDLVKAERFGSARYYKTALGILKSYCNNKQIAFRDINFKFLTKYETAHLAKGNSLNGLAANMRAYRAIFNRAIEDGIVEKELYPFDKYQIKLTKTRKRAISMDAIKLVQDVDLPINHPLYHTRNYFLISFFMRGMPFVDIAQLRLSNIIGGRVYYQRQKTDKPYNIKITEEVQEILDLYTKEKVKDDFIFPIIKRVELHEQYKDIEWARNRYNKKLKKIAALCGIEENLTSYVSRHSFATRAKNLGVPIATISDMLGHSDTKTTEIYLDSLQSDLMDEAHEKIIR